MSLVRFKGQNHHQQVSRRGARPEVDDRATTPEVFDPLNERFRFTVDVAALPHNAKLPRYFTPEQDGLSQSWAGERVWCNPPYSSIEPWVEKAWWESAYAEVIVMLVPANRTEQGWWHRHVEPYRDRSSKCGYCDSGVAFGPMLLDAAGVRSTALLKTEFMLGRIRFIAHDADEVRPNERPPFGSMLLIWERSS